jgi:hypothetical protein
MPTILRSGAYRFYFYSHEPDEPPHIHCDRDNLSVKFWLNAVELAKNYGFNDRELRQIESLVKDHQTEFLGAWHEYFGNPD